jgi:hypothetical protein
MLVEIWNAEAEERFERLPIAPSEIDNSAQNRHWNCEQIVISNKMS